jgi:hypothetical protein
MTPFLTKEITNEKEYFGRDHIINALVSFANMGHCKEIIGLRRSGKTSLLKIMEGKLRGGKSKVYPVFFNFKDAGAYEINGTQSVYKYMIARLMARLYEDELLNGNYTVRGQTIIPSSNWEDIYECLPETKISLPKAIAMFSELIKSCAIEIKKSILFLIDEYECLFKERFAKPVGFMPMRSLSNETTPDGNNFFSFWIAGATDWATICTQTGSGELNVIDSPTVYLNFLDRESFHLMWEHEISFCQDEDKKRFLSGKEETAFVLSGGFPFFGKQIGCNFLISGKDPDTSIFNSHFKDMLNSFNKLEMQCLSDLTKGNQDYLDEKIMFRLEEIGLINKQGQKYIISIPYMAKFIISTDTASVRDNYPESCKIADETEEYYELINKNCKNNSKPPIFILGSEVTLGIWKNIRTPCTSRDDFGRFIRGLYQFMLDATKDRDPISGLEIKRLPKDFMRHNSTTKYFFDIVRYFRHFIGGAHQEEKFKNYEKQFYVDVLQNLLGSKNEPQTKEEFSKLQIEVLKLFKNAMYDLLQIVKSGNF